MMFTWSQVSQVGSLEYQPGHHKLNSKGKELKFPYVVESSGTRNIKFCYYMFVHTMQG